MSAVSYDGLQKQNSIIDWQSQGMSDYYWVHGKHSRSSKPIKFNVSVKDQTEFA